MKRVLVPCCALACLNLAIVQIVGDAGFQFSAGNAPKNLLHDRRSLLVDFVATVSAAPVAKRQRPVHLALAGVVHQSAHDVLRHVLRIELVDVHHRAQGKPSGCVIPEFFLAIDHVHAVLRQLIFVGQRVEHIAADAIRLVRQHDLKFVLLRRAHHLLELRPPIRPTGHGAICVDPDDLIAVLPRIFLAFIDLLFDAGVVLRMAGIAGVNYCGQVKGFLLRAHTLAPFQRLWHMLIPIRPRLLRASRTAFFGVR